MRSLRRFSPNVHTLIAAALAIVITLLLVACAGCDAQRLDDQVAMRTAAVPLIMATPTTSTTVAEHRAVNRATRGAARAQPVAIPREVPRATGSVNGYPCGGDLPPCWVLMRESRGNPNAVNPRGCSGRGCGGLWQFDPKTWAGYGGFARAELAPAEVQNAKARSLWAGGRGCRHWAACGR